MEIRVRKPMKITTRKKSHPQLAMTLGTVWVPGFHHMDQAFVGLPWPVLPGLTICGMILQVSSSSDISQ